MFIFKIDFYAKRFDKPSISQEKLRKVEEHVKNYQNGTAVGYEIICHDGSFKIDKWCLQSCDELKNIDKMDEPEHLFPLRKRFEGMISKPSK